VTDFEISAEDPTGPTLTAIAPAGSRFYDGHFPGRPVLPAIAQLSLVERLIRLTHGQDARIVAIERLRLLHPLVPGDPLRVRIEPAPPGAPCRFVIERHDEQVTTGVVAWRRDTTS